MSTVREQLKNLTHVEPGTRILELEVHHNNNPYRMVGVLMEVGSDTVRIAFSSKNDVVVDELVLTVEEIVSIRIVEESEIQKIL